MNKNTYYYLIFGLLIANIVLSIIIFSNLSNTEPFFTNEEQNGEKKKNEKKNNENKNNDELINKIIEAIDKLGRALLSLESGAIFLDKDNSNKNNSGKLTPKEILENVKKHCDDIIMETSNFDNPPKDDGKIRTMSEADNSLNEKEDGGRNLLAVENMTIQALKMIQKMQEQTNGLN